VDSHMDEELVRNLEFTFPLLLKVSHMWNKNAHSISSVNHL
jgi:hypothetical protein